MSSTTKTPLNYPKFVVNYRSQQRCSTIETAGRDVTNSKLPTYYDKSTDQLSVDYQIIKHTM